jgi:hypothetical protein
VSTPLSQTVVQFGREPRQDFNASCQPLDWQPIDVTFPQPFPTADVRVIVTANDFNVDSEPDNLPVAGVVEQLTAQGFRLWGRNPSYCARSSAGFNWLAVAGTPARERSLNVDLRLGMVQPREISARCDAFVPLLPKLWEVKLAPQRKIGTPDELPIVLATACNLNNWAPTVDPPSLQAVEISFERMAAVVAVVQTPSPVGFRLKAVNSDPLRGSCAFYHAMVAQRQEGAGSGDVLIESGRVGAKQFAPSDNTGDWQVWEVSFDDPFMTPPIVLLTTNDLLENGNPVPDRGPSFAKAVAAVGMAWNVTTHGFTLVARNSDCGGGFAGFYWVAIGCERFCA